MRQCPTSCQEAQEGSHAGPGRHHPARGLRRSGGGRQGGAASSLAEGLDETLTLHRLGLYGVLDDRLTGYQVLGGVDYAVSEAVSLGVKVRWVRFGRLTAEDIEWERLRSHASQLRLDGSEPVTFRIWTGDALSFVGINVAIAVHLLTIAPFAGVHNRSFLQDVRVWTPC